MKPLLYTISGAVIVGIIFVFLLLKFFGPNVSQQPAVNNTGNSTLPDVGSGITVPQTQLIKSITDSRGNTVKTKDFIANDPTVSKDTSNAGSYHLGVTPGIVFNAANANGKMYDIAYVDSDQSFTIVLLKTPLSTARTQAEQYLQKTLGITVQQMCHLRYSVSVPYYVDSNYTGLNLGFSFCPDATELP